MRPCSCIAFERRQTVDSGLPDAADALCVFTGTMFVSETSRQLYLHKLSLSPEETLCRVMKLPSPEPDRGDMSCHEVSASWAPDDSMVALHYNIGTLNDLRSVDTGLFQVQAMCALLCPEHTCCLSAQHPAETGPAVSVDLADGILKGAESAQVVHLLNVTTHALLCLTDSSERSQVATLEKVCFTPDSKFILTTFSTSEGALLEVHSRNGQPITQIRPQNTHDVMVVAGLNSNRAAVASKFGKVTVWCLLTGLQTGAVTVYHTFGDPPEEILYESQVLGLELPTHASLLCTDRHGACFAYINMDYGKLQLFEAATMQTLGSYGLPKAMISYNQLSSDGCLSMAVMAFSWWLHSHPNRRTQPVHLSCWDIGSSWLREMLQALSSKEPALSEDEAFAACVCQGSPATIQVTDLRSGAMVLAHDLDLPGGNDVLERVAVTWCGSQLLVTAKLEGAGARVSTDHILVLQL